MSISTPPLPGTTIDPLYPDSDDEPLAETDLHLLAIIYLHGALKHFFRARCDAGVWADLFLYYEEGDGSKRKAPDVMVAFGVVGKHARRSFRTWEEAVVPAVIFEITSKKTVHEDEHGKKDVYAQLGVKEYFLFDPEDRTIRPQLQAFRLREGLYEPLFPDNSGRITSQELGLMVVVEGALPRLIDPQNGQRLMSPSEAFDAADEAKQTAEQAEQKVKQAEQSAEQAEQKAEQAERKAEQAEQTAEQAEQKVKQAEQQTEQAQQQAERAQQQAEQARQQAEQARQQVEQAQQQVEQAQQQAEQAQQQAEQAQQQVEQAQQQAEQAQQKVGQAQQQVELARREVEVERQRARALEEENARLRAAQAQRPLEG